MGFEVASSNKPPNMSTLNKKSNIYPERMGLFGNKELQSGTCNDGEPGASPLKQSGKYSFKKGKGSRERQSYCLLLRSALDRGHHSAPFWPPCSLTFPLPCILFPITNFSKLHRKENLHKGSLRTRTGVSIWIYTGLIAEPRVRISLILLCSSGVNSRIAVLFYRPIGNVLDNCFSKHLRTYQFCRLLPRW